VPGETGEGAQRPVTAASASAPGPLRKTAPMAAANALALLLMSGNAAGYAAMGKAPWTAHTSNGVLGGIAPSVAASVSVRGAFAPLPLVVAGLVIKHEHRRQLRAPALALGRRCVHGGIGMFGHLARPLVALGVGGTGSGNCS